MGLFMRNNLGPSYTTLCDALTLFEKIFSNSFKTSKNLNPKLMGLFVNNN
jgi:hypothetical protein